MNTLNVNSVVNVAVENKSNFQLRQVTVKAQNNESLFKLIEKAIERKPIQMIVTPRVDVAGHPYYWVGVRFDFQELDFKLQVNEQIMNFILTYLKGEEPLPTVTEFEATEKIEDVREWLLLHEATHSRSAISFKEELAMKGDMNYLTTKLVFLNGKINYPSTKCEDVLSLILA